VVVSNNYTLEALCISLVYNVCGCPNKNYEFNQTDYMCHKFNDTQFGCSALIAGRVEEERIEVTALPKFQQLLMTYIISVHLIE